MPVSRTDVVTEARRWLGVPWRHQGRTRAGIDCVGLIALVARDLGISTYDYTSYGRRAHGQAFVHHFANNMDAVRVAEAQPGDVLVFADHAYPCHCGFVTEKFDQRHLLHAHASRRQVIEEPYIGEWPAKVKFAFRFRGVSEDSKRSEEVHVAEPKDDDENAGEHAGAGEHERDDEGGQKGGGEERLQDIIPNGGH